MILDGVETNQTIPLEEQQLLDDLEHGAIRVDPSNQIDFIIFAVDAELLQKGITTLLVWCWAKVDVQSHNYYKDLFELI